MQFQISTEPGGESFTADPGQTVLEAALAAGLLLPYGCRDGACGACKAQLMSGRIDQGTVSATALTDEERAAGQALLCQARPLTDLVIKVHNVGRVGDIPVRKLPCRVQELRLAAPDVMVVTVRLPANETFAFRAGQYIDFLLADGRRRSFSIANAPDGAGQLELHVRRIEGGSFTGHVFETMKVRDILRFEGPLGAFYLRDDTERPAVLLAGGTGFAPIKSMVEQAIAIGSGRKMILYWGARNREGLYMDELARSWEDALSGFRYVPVLSDASAADAWTGRTGLVHRAVIEDLPDLSGHEVYACGAPAMIEAARHDFALECGMAEAAFFSDAFTYSPDAVR